MEFLDGDVGSVHQNKIQIISRRRVRSTRETILLSTTRNYRRCKAYYLNIANDSWLVKKIYIRKFMKSIVLRVLVSTITMSISQPERKVPNYIIIRDLFFRQSRVEKVSGNFKKQSYYRHRNFSKRRQLVWK